MLSALGPTAAACVGTGDSGTLEDVGQGWARGAGEIHCGSGDFRGGFHGGGRVDA